MRDVMFMLSLKRKSDTDWKVNSLYDVHMGFFGENLSDLMGDSIS